jgi:hypothetical protein
MRSHPLTCTSVAIISLIEPSVSRPDIRRIGAKENEFRTLQQLPDELVTEFCVVWRDAFQQELSEEDAPAMAEYLASTYTLLLDDALPLFR